MTLTQKSHTELNRQPESQNGPQRLVATFVRCAPQAGMSSSTARTIAEHARPMFEGMPGLHSKLFSFRADTQEALNVYVWDSMEAAKTFFNPHVMELIERTYGVVPEVSFAEVSTLIENHVLRDHTSAS